MEALRQTGLLLLPRKMAEQHAQSTGGALYGRYYGADDENTASAFFLPLSGLFTFEDAKPDYHNLTL